MISSNHYHLFINSQEFHLILKLFIILIAIFSFFYFFSFFFILSLMSHLSLTIQFIHLFFKEKNYYLFHFKVNLYAINSLQNLFIKTQILKNIILFLKNTFINNIYITIFFTSIKYNYTPVLIN